MLINDRRKGVEALCLRSEGGRLVLVSPQELGVVLVQGRDRFVNRVDGALLRLGDFRQQTLLQVGNLFVAVALQGLQILFCDFVGHSEFMNRVWWCSRNVAPGSIY